MRFVLLALFLISQLSFAQKIDVAVQRLHIPVDGLFTQDDKKLVTIAGGEIKVWEMKTGLLQKTIQTTTSPLFHLSLSADGNYAVVAGYTMADYVNLTTGEVIARIACNQNAAVLHPNKPYIIQGEGLSCQDASGKSIWARREKSFTFLRISNDGKFLAAYQQRDGALVIMNPDNGDELYSLKIQKLVPGKESMVDMRFNKASGKLFALFETGQLYVFDVTKGKKIYSGRTGVKACKKGHFTYNDNILFLGSEKVMLYDWKADKLSETFGTKGEYTQLVAAGNGSPVFTSAYRDPQPEMALFNIESGSKGQTYGTATSILSDVLFSEDDTMIGGTLKDHRRTERKFVIDMKGAWAIQPRDDKVKLRTKEHAHHIKNFPDMNRAPDAYASSADGKFQAFGTSKDLKLFRDGALVMQLDGEKQDFHVTSLGYDYHNNVILESRHMELLMYTGNNGSLMKKFEYTTRFASSKDGKHLLTNTKRNLQLRGGKQPFDVIKEVQNPHQGKIETIEVSDRFVITTGQDGLIKLWKYPALEFLATIYPIDIHRRIIVLPDGYYMADKNINVRDIAFRFGDQTYPIDQFDLKYNRPDIVLERLGGATPQLVAAYKKAYEQRLKKSGIREDMLSAEFHIPEVALSRLPESTVKLKQIQYKMNATDDLYHLSKLNFYVNNVPLYGTRGLPLDPATSVEKDITIELTKGLNVIQTSVVNDRGVESLRETFTVTYEGAELKPALYVVAVGVSKFRDSGYDLTYASKDAKDIVSLFQSPKALEKYSRVEHFIFQDQDATRENIMNVRNALAKSKVDDEVLVFVATHGLLDDDLNYYLATHDVNFDMPAGRGLLYEDLESMMDGISARKKWMLLDACHSGEVDKEETVLVNTNEQFASNVKSRGFKAAKSKDEGIGLRNSFELMQQLFADFRKGTGTIVISSASGTEFAFESSEWKNGVFTYSLLEGLQNDKADADKNGVVLVSELKKYITDRVEKLTNGKQHPTSRTDNLENDFPAW